MCGILGGNDPDWDYKAGILSMKHRGPDGQRIVKFNEFTMAFARLSIMDLSENGMQPMLSENEDVCIVFNGEIYGFQKLRNKLISKGYHFKSSSDTEVILYSYMEYGDRFIQYIDGMFAIAIYDRRVHEIKMFRDRVGIKPFYYYYDGKRFGFSSELKGILSMCNNCQFQEDFTALYDYLTYSYIPEPKTIYKNTFKLQPAHYLIFDIKKKKVKECQAYWSLKVNSEKGQKRNKKEVEEEVTRLIKKSVKDQLIADVPVGSFLSGGIDSSIISTEIYKQDHEIEAFSMGFADEAYDETKYARILCERYPININVGCLGKEDFKQIYHSLVNWYDEPYADTSGFPTYKVSKMAREKVKVVLTGDGGDEVFGGYQRYFLFTNEMKRKKHPLDCRWVSDLHEKTIIHTGLYSEKIEDYLLEDIVTYAKISGYMRSYEKQQYAKEWKISHDYDDFWYFRQFYEKDLPLMTRVQFLDLNTYLPSDILTKVDRATMQVSLEARVPFLSRDILEFSFGLSEEDRCPQNVLKGLLKNAYHDIIPHEILYRKKMGFGIPARYMRSAQKAQEELLHSVWKY